jgi:predicted AlkP superfamily pyrophosphatase or phosphodiesterase
MTDDAISTRTVIAPPPGQPVELPVLAPGSSDRKVLLVGVDGLRWDRIAAADAPVLTALMTDGLYATGAHDPASPAQTVSGPGWSTLATGTSPQRHGVRDNSFRGRRYDQCPDFMALAKRAIPDVRSCAVIDWAPLVDMGTFGPEIDVRIRFDGDRFGFFAEDLRTIDVATQLLTETDPDITFVYIGCVDEAGHRTGPLSSAYMARITAADQMIGRLLDAVRGRRTYRDEQWLVLVTTDHGHLDEGGHGGTTEAERAIFVIASGSGIPAGTRTTGVRTVDVAPTVLDHLGVVPDPSWHLEGRSLLRGSPSVASPQR